ncbi:MAG: T9SS type A sorting domain-containing protein [Bacteroidales bacterium]|nr:T9SS type A sorting domain-containing protein [Bacteroidales bacterium]
MKKILLSLVLASSIAFYISAQVNLLKNGDMEEQGAWKVSQGNLLDTVWYEFGSTENTVNGGDGANLAIKIKAKGTSNTNLSVYQQLELVGGEEYLWSCAMRDLSTDHNCWWIKYAYFDLEPLDGSDPTEKDIAVMHEWLSGKIYNFNGLWDTCAAAYTTETNTFTPEADGIYYVGINLGTCDTLGNYHFIIDEIALIDQDATSGINAQYSDNGIALKLYPNPASTYIDFTYSISENSDVKLSLINILGHEVAIITNESRIKGTYTESFDCSNLADGIYYGVLKTNNTSITKKFIVLKFE